MRLFAAVVLLAVTLHFAAPHASTQEPDVATINTFVYLDLNNDGKFSSGEDSTTLQPTCRVLVLEGGVSVALDSPSLPIVTQAVPDASGHAAIELPPGDYRVAYERCAPTPPIRTGHRRPNLSISEYREYEPGCCPHVEGTPKLVVVEPPFAGPQFLAHDVSLGRGDVVELTLRAYPSSAASDRALRWVLWAGTALFILMIVVGYLVARARGRV